MEKNSNRKIPIFFILMLGFIAGIYYSAFKEKKISEELNFSILNETWQIIEKKFYDLSDEDKEKMIYGAAKGAVESLDDPYSNFLDPEETLEFEESLEGTYEGIGAEIGIRDDILTIISPIEGTPAKKAGILAGDKILKIDKEATEGMTLIDAVIKIRGKEGEEVILKIKRKEKIFDVKIKRAKIKIPTLNYEEINEEIAHIQLYNFYEDAFFEFEKTAQNILSSKKDKIILDLRNNPGGYLESAVDIGGFFVNKGKLIVKEEFGDGSIREMKSQGPGSFSDFNIIILINEGSASASEILAGTIKENNSKVKIIGKKTFGKGTVQEFIYLDDDSSIKLTVAKWLLPSGESINEKGITPDIEVEMTEDDINKDKDPQLKKAIEEILK